MTAIVNTKIFLPESLLWDGVILIEGDRILRFGKTGEVEIPDNCQRVDAHGKYTGPGFVDIHTHGGGGHWFFEEPALAAAHFLSRGETFILPALYFNLTEDEYLAGLEKISSVIKQAHTFGGAGLAIGGVYMEGPFLNAKYGADKVNNPWSGAIDKGQYDKLLDACKDILKIHCVAPEREGIIDFVRDAAAATPGVIFSIAHSEAYPSQMEPLLQYNLRLITHFNDATGTVTHYPEVKGFGLDEYALLNNDIYTELICDSRGIHADPWMLRFVLKFKGRERIILISDSTEFKGPASDTFEGAPDIRYDYDGEIAGSALTLDAACRNMMSHTGAGLCDVFRFASTNPAALLGLSHEIGSIREGAYADLVMVDDMVRVHNVYYHGVIMD